MGRGGGRRGGGREDFNSSTGMESGQLVHYSAGGVCTHCDVTSIGGDGEDMGCGIEGADSHPPTIIAETHVLDLQRKDLTLDDERANSITRGAWKLAISSIKILPLTPTSK